MANGVSFHDAMVLCSGSEQEPIFDRIDQSYYPAGAALCEGCREVRIVRKDGRFMKHYVSRKNQEAR